MGMIDNMGIKSKIKVVFWDLDDTLWKGTLAEGDDVQIFLDRVDIINQLNRRGIVNSICSKNEYETTKNKLEQIGIWDLFVFPQIAFAPKGELIKSALDNMHLRDENALFIDDNDLNLREVEFYNPNISVLNVSSVDVLLQNVNLIGKEDIALSRYHQYKQLERKNQEKNKFSSNIEFLKACNIKLKFVCPNDDNFDRLFELSDRTNQLNFTKNRMTEEQLKLLVGDKAVETKLIHAKDNFGDYGFVGFYSIRDNCLIHFVFSCRIMSMGIEQFVYQFLGQPELSVVGEVASDVKDKENVDWISLTDELEDYSCDKYSVDNVLDNESKIKIFGIGACDLYHPIAYFSMPNQQFIYECNVFKGKERGVNVGTEYIRSQFEMNDEEKEFCKTHFYNYTGHLAFNSKILSNDYDYIIMSFHDDMVFKVYENKTNNNIRVILSPSHNYGVTSIQNIYGKEIADISEQREWLNNNFFTGEYITSERFRENLIWLLERIPQKTKLLLINGPELNFFRSNNPKDDNVRKQIFVINQALNDLEKEYPERIAVVDINKVITSRATVTDYVFHLKAQTAYKLFIQIVRTIKKRFPSNKPSMLHNVVNSRKVVIFGNGSEARNAFYNLIIGGESPVKYVHYDYRDKCIGTMSVEDYQLVLTGNKEKYYVVIADRDNQKKIIEKLLNLDYQPLVDFVSLTTIKYKKCWNEMMT